MTSTERDNSPAPPPRGAAPVSPPAATAWSASAAGADRSADPSSGASGHGATILGISGPSLTRDERVFLAEADPWGIILFARNVQDPAQLLALTADLRATLGREALVMVDQEGGRVQRLRAPHWTDWPSPLQAAAGGAAAVSRLYYQLGQELRAVGIDGNAAPGLDLARPDTHPFLFDRCLGQDVPTVAALGRAAADGLLAAGVLPCIKHMPGHGRARADSHQELPVVETPLEELIATDFAPFAALADMPLGMTAHIRFTAIDDAPATASARVIGLIRSVIGFDGLLMSDDIGMSALSGSIADRATASIRAGCDVVLQCSGDLADMAQAVAAAGRMTPEAARRAAAALGRRRGGADVAPPPAGRDLAATPGAPPPQG